jgi:hypothetical protein
MLNCRLRAVLLGADFYQSQFLLKEMLMQDYQKVARMNDVNKVMLVAICLLPLLANAQHDEMPGPATVATLAGTPGRKGSADGIGAASEFISLIA